MYLFLSQYDVQVGKAEAASEQAKLVPAKYHLGVFLSVQPRQA